MAIATVVRILSAIRVEGGLEYGHLVVLTGADAPAGEEASLVVATTRLDGMTPEAYDAQFLEEVASTANGHLSTRTGGTPAAIEAVTDWTGRPLGGGIDD
jgi:hypothetical protein